MAAPDQHTNRFRIEVDGSPISDAVDGKLLSAYVDNALNLPDMFVLVFRDQDRDVIEDGKFKIGAKVTVKVHNPDLPGGEKLTEGEITALEADIDTQGTLTVVRGLDRSHRLFRGRHTKAFKQMTYSDIARQVAGDVGLTIGKVDSTTPRFEHVTQANCTDWVFLRGLAQEVGYDMGVVDGKFNFSKPEQSAEAPEEGTLQDLNPLQLTLGANLIRCRTTVSAADQVQNVEVRGWDERTKRVVTERTPPRTDTLQLGTTPAELAAKFGNAVLVSTDVPFVTQDEVKTASTALAQAVASGMGELDGLARGNPKIKAGKAVSLGLVKEPFDGKYTVTTTRHAFDPDEGYTTSFGVTGRADRSLHGLTAGGGGSWDRPSSSPIHGVVVGVVSDARDPDKKGRVKIKLPWLAEDYESDWARVVQAGAGDKRGWAIVPEVDDEVLVAFHHGDVRLPFVIGGLYNGKDKPHSKATDDWIDGTSGQVNIRSFTSRLGHRIQFADGPRKQQVHLTTDDDGYRMTLDKTETKITLHSDGKIEIEAQQDISIKSTGGKIAIEAQSGNVEIKGMQVKINGSAGVDIDGGPQVKATGGMIQLN